MAVIRSVVMGKSHKRVGDVTTYRKKGQECVRSLPLTVKNPRTDLQVAQRDKFKAALEFCQLGMPVISKYFINQKKGATNFNGAQQYNLNNAVELVGGVYVIDPTKVKLTKGPLNVNVGISATNPSAQSIVFTWVDNSGEGNALPTDLFGYIWYNTTDGKMLSALTTQTRSVQSYSFSAPAGWSGKDVAVYGFFVKANKKMTSNSVYVATLTLH